jgi:putative Mg2+ transporter-C (MgtC) family protein
MDWISELQDLGLVILAGLLGAVLGFEREASDKPAGLRTHVFVCAGSTLLILLGEAVVSTFESHDAGMVRADPTRVIQAIVVGISFLGAGTIIHHGTHRVEGLTTAASIFLTAGIGIAVAAERLVVAGGTTLFALLVLTLVRRVEYRFGEPSENSGDQGD